MALAESCKIAYGQQVGGCLVHKVEVEGIGEVARISMKKGVLSGMNIIVIGACPCTEACMHVAVDGVQAGYRDVGGKQSVEPIDELWGVYCFWGIEMGYHLSGMYACIGASGSHDIDLPAQNGAQGLLQRLLNTGGIGLLLPPVITQAVVGEMDEITLHGLVSGRVVWLA